MIPAPLGYLAYKKSRPANTTPNSTSHTLPSMPSPINANGHI